MAGIIGVSHHALQTAVYFLNFTGFQLKFQGNKLLSEDRLHSLIST
jgi:hypothetical protein